MTYEPSKTAIEAAAIALNLLWCPTCQPFESTDDQHQEYCRESARAALIATRKVENTLRVESPNLHARFQAMVPDAPLPWRFSEHDSGLADASGVGICMLGQTPSERRILAMILTAVNTCGGFKAIAAPPATEGVR